MRLNIFSLAALVFLAGCIPPKVTVCVLDVPNQVAYCVPPDQPEKDVPLSQLKDHMHGNPVCMSPDDFAILLKWIEQHK